MKLKMRIYHDHTLISLTTFQNSVQIPLRLSVTSLQNTPGKLLQLMFLYKVENTIPRQQIDSDCSSHIRQSKLSAGFSERDY